LQALLAVAEKVSITEVQSGAELQIMQRRSGSYASSFHTLKL
jgi:hypothetical protein